MSVPENQPAVVLYKISGAGVLLLGVAGLIAAIAMLLYAAAAASAGKPVAEINETPPAKRGFQLVQLGDFRRDHFLVDADTGRVWQSVCSGDVKNGDCDGTMIWLEMCVEGTTTSKNSMLKCLNANINLR